MSAITTENLLSMDEEVSTLTWKEFLFNARAAVDFLKTSSAETVQQVLAAGGQWNGMGWNTTRAAKTVKELTGVALVTGNFREYLHAYLYSPGPCIGC